MKWLEATVKSSSAELDGLCAKLESLGVEGLCIEDEQDFRRFLEQNQQYWDYVDSELEQKYTGLSQVRFYLQDDADGLARLKELETALGQPLSFRRVADEDWENSWKQYYAPIPIGKRLMVVPAWLDPELEGRLPLRLDPGLTFGTGSHATTRMCLELLDALDPSGWRVLDLGCGSGILGIGALLLGAGDVTLRVSRQGGKVIDMVNAAGGCDGGLSPEEALQAAREFLSARGYDSMAESYWTKENGSLLVNFHHKEGDVICYPDLIKVRVDLTAGQIIGFDATGYLMSHRSRSPAAPIPAEKAESAVSPSLRVLSRSLAVIPTEGKQERLCWEFKCRDREGAHFIVYADAATGKEVKLLYLLEDENGTLVL